MKVLLKNNNDIELFPKTKAELVDGLVELLAEKLPTIKCPVAFSKPAEFTQWANTLADIITAKDYNGCIQCRMGGTNFYLYNIIRRAQVDNPAISQHMVISWRPYDAAANLYKAALWSRYYETHKWTDWERMSGGVQKSVNANTEDDGFTQSSQSSGNLNRAILVAGNTGTGAETKIFQNGGRLYFRRAVYAPDGNTPGYYTTEIPTATASSNGLLSGIDKLKLDSIDGKLSSKADLENGTIKSSQIPKADVYTLGGIKVGNDVFTDGLKFNVIQGNYNAEVKIPIATAFNNDKAGGLLSGIDKLKLDSIESGSQKLRIATMVDGERILGGIRTGGWYEDPYFRPVLVEQDGTAYIELPRTIIIH